MRGGRALGKLRAEMAEEDRQKWDDVFRSGRHGPQDAPSWLQDLDSELPRAGAALDVAAGAGRMSLWMARRGLDVVAVDISPVGLALTREAGADEGVRIRTEVADLERDTLPDGPFALIACFHYRQTTLFPDIRHRLAPGGVVVAELATLRNLERNDRPSRRYLAETNELIWGCAGLEVVYYREGWLGSKHVARIAARKPVPR